MTSKTKAFWSSLVSGFFTLCGGVALMPDSLTKQIAQPFPEAARAYIGVGFLALAWVGKTYSTKHAAASGPDTPPANPPSV